MGKGSIYNFCAGPSMLPIEVIEDLKQPLSDWNNTGVSILELNHRSKKFDILYDSVIEKLKSIIDIPENFEILFLHGGATMQFSMVPMNLLGAAERASYVNTGTWSEKAIEEAKKYGKITISAEFDKVNNTLTQSPGWVIDQASSYLHYTSNETIDGIGFNSLPIISSVPLVADMSSDIFTKTLTIKDFGLIYASTQKNIGISGLCLVIVNKELINLCNKAIPEIFKYQNQIEKRSTYNTPFLFSWYTAGVMFDWIRKNGGLSKMQDMNDTKSSLLYEYIDSSSLYSNKINPLWRSKVNVVFDLVKETLTDHFIKEAANEGLINLKGHKSLGGIRASIYNAMPLKGVEKLISFMKYFEEINCKYL